MANSKITIGGGCFWCVEAVFQQVEGVSEVVSGYSAGQIPNPTYQQICTGTTGHAEVIQITFDSDVVTAETLYDLFFRAHDPTTLNRQGADRGTQYRSIILYHDEAQREVAEQVMEKAKAYWSDPIVTQIEALDVFYPAEDYHQDYYRSHTNQPYCMVVIRPKLEKLGLKT